MKSTTYALIAVAAIAAFALLREHWSHGRNAGYAKSSCVRNG